jgi:hypothetical protein
MVQKSKLGGSLVTTSWHVLMLWMEETASKWEGSCEALKKQLWTADKG